jgi:hypothetical protein
VVAQEGLVVLETLAKMVKMLRSLHLHRPFSSILIPRMRRPLELDLFPVVGQDYLFLPNAAPSHNAVTVIEYSLRGPQGV